MKQTVSIELSPAELKFLTRLLGHHIYGGPTGIHPLYEKLFREGRKGFTEEELDTPLDVSENYGEVGLLFAPGASI